ncbi:uncharacterized protein TNCV_4294131 [Trichonephila clavipes]|uniref:Uncharacterized protein n=1 Tax=Trichonephila clavipes TaxID=2585209 RepID=A0A8X6V4N2_TRICX|nr:uncharacterized protein TNCV_4294131 [Trichonephila clavipes]
MINTAPTKPQKAFWAFCGLRPHFHKEVRRHLNEHGVMPYHFFLRGFIKDKVCVPLLPRDLVELRGRIRMEFAAVARDMLVRVWTEMEYHLDICRVPKRPY